MSERPMSTARDEILASIRHALNVTAADAPRRAAVAARLSAHAKGIIPQRGQLQGRALIECFMSQATAALATVVEVSEKDVPGEVARYLRENNLPATLKMGSDIRLNALNWAATTLSISFGASDGADLNGLSHAFGGVAETGTLVMVSGEDNPTTLNFLPDNHIVVLRAADIAGDYESVLGKIRDRFSGTLPRTVNMITGPSRSADIEQKMLLGAHGPRRLHIIIVA